MSGISTLDIRHTRNIGGKAVLYYLSTMIIAASSGIGWVSLIQPGKERGDGGGGVPVAPLPPSVNGSTPDTLDSFLNILEKLFPSNAVVAAYEMNILGIIVIALVFGIVMNQLGEEADAFKRVVVALDKMIQKVVDVVLWYVPIGR